MTNAGLQWAVDTPAQAAALFTDIRDRAYTPEDRARQQRSLDIVQALMPYAWGLSGGTRCGMGELAEQIRLADETAETARRALLAVVPYLSGDRGPFDLVFLYRGKPVSEVSFEGDEMQIRDEGGTLLPLNEVILVLERRAFAENAAK